MIILKIAAAIILATLALNLFFWVFLWLVEKPFDIIGWSRMYADYLDYTYCKTRMDYVVQTICLLMTIGIHIMMIVVSFYLLNNKS